MQEMARRPGSPRRFRVPLEGWSDKFALRYGIAILSVAAATVLRYIFDPALGQQSPFPTFLLAVLVTARYCGLRPGVAALALGLASADFFLIDPRGEFGFKGAAEYVDLMFYIAVGLSIALVGGAMHAASAVQDRELRTAMETLFQTEERLALTLKSTGVSVWSWDILTDTVRGDENAAAQFGIPLEQFPKSIAEFSARVAPADRERVQREVAASLEHDATYDTEFRTEWPDQSIHWLSTRGRVYRGDAGQPVRFMGVCWDVTDRRQAEEQLRAVSRKLLAEARFRELIEAAPDAVVVVNRAGLIVLVNAQAEVLFAYDRTDLVGQKLEMLLPESVRLSHGSHRETFWNAPRSRHMSTRPELRARRKDGTEVAVEISLSPLQTEDGLLVSATIRDVTERKRAERTRDMLASIVDYSDDAIIAKAVDGTIVNWNGGAERLYGYSAEEAIGRPISLILPPDAGNDLDAVMARLARGEVIKEETVRRRKDGVLIDVALTMSPIRNADGAVTAASSIARDISERKRAERHIVELNGQLAKSASLAEAANLAKSTFLSTMSHEIRTPMNAILGYAQLMSRDGSLRPEAKEHLKIIGRSGEHLLSLINDVLDMSKIEAGRVDLAPVTFNLPRLLDDLGAMFRFRAASKGLEFELLTRGEPLAYVVADEGKIRQVLINLLGNAVKFTRSGRIALLATIEPRDAGQRWLSVSVEDTGPGIEARSLAMLFEPFSQAKAELNTQQGTGLGLAISRKFTRLMGGDITVRSVAGKGSTFLFEIPIEAGNPNAVGRTHAHGTVLGLRDCPEPPRILVADDHPENRDWLTQLLRSIGFDVRTAENGGTAVAGWESWQPRLILMDVHMPVMDGLEATRQIILRSGERRPVIVALTASAMEEDRETALGSGADDFVAKPCAADELLVKIGKLLGLSYQYEQLPEPGAAPAPAPPNLDETLHGLAPELREELAAATVSGNRRLLGTLIERVRQTHAEGATALQELVDRYDYDALIRAVEAPCPR